MYVYLLLISAEKIKKQWQCSVAMITILGFQCQSPVKGQGLLGKTMVDCSNGAVKVQGGPRIANYAKE